MTVSYKLWFIIEGEREFLSLRSVTGGPHKLLDPCPVNFNKLVGNFAKNNETPHSSHFDIVVCELNRLTMHRTVTSEIHLALTEKQRNDTPRTTCLYLLSAIKRTAPNQSEIRTLSKIDKQKNDE